MRGDSVLTQQSEQPVVVPTNRKNHFIAANIISPEDGTVQYHIVSTRLFNIVVVSVVTLLLCGLVILASILYLKKDVDQNSQRIEELHQEQDAR